MNDAIRWEIKHIHDNYKKQWLEGDFNSIDDLLVDLFNDLEDCYTQGRRGN